MVVGSGAKVTARGCERRWPSDSGHPRSGRRCAPSSADATDDGGMTALAVVVADWSLSERSSPASCSAAVPCERSRAAGHIDGLRADRTSPDREAEMVDCAPPDRARRLGAARREAGAAGGASSAGRSGSLASRRSCCPPWRSGSLPSDASRASSCSASATTRSGSGAAGTTEPGPSKFDTEAKELLATLRRKGARQFVWVTLRDARRAVIPSRRSRSTTVTPGTSST